MIKFIPLEKYPLACQRVEYTSFENGKEPIPRHSPVRDKSLNGVNFLRRVIIFAFISIFFAGYAFADVKTDVYSKLKCCPCKKTDFASSNCAIAKEIKAYIDGLLEGDLKENDILFRLAKKFSLDVIIDKETKRKIEERLIREAGDRRPQIYLKPLSYKLGKVSKSKGSLNLVVEVQNRGKGVLTINGVKTSCECTKARIEKKGVVSSDFGPRGSDPHWKIDFAPGEKGKLIIITDLNHPHVRIGHLLRVVEISSNDPLHSLIRVDFEAEIVE